LVQQLRLVLLELFVIEPYVASRLRVNVRGQNWIRAKLSKAVKVELSSETAKIGMLKVQWKHTLLYQKGERQTKVRNSKVESRC
jgi:hypothetical protein